MGKLFKYENGSVMIPVILVLAMLSIVGLTAANTTNIELQIVRNKLMYKQNLYLAEAVVMAQAQRLELSDPDTLKAGGVTGIFSDVDMRDPSNWASNSLVAFDDDDDGVTEQDIVLRRGETNTLRYSIVDMGVVRGSSLSMAGTTTQMHLYSIFGRYQSLKHGQALIEMRYKRRY